jgi:hypothetical protein
VTHAYNPSYSRGRDQFKASPGKYFTKLSRKYPIQKKKKVLVQVVERLPSKHEALSSNSGTAPPKKKKEEKN